MLFWNTCKETNILKKINISNRGKKFKGADGAVGDLESMR
jgi:hypothetical protein